MKCPYCESGTNDFVPMNQTAEYSGIEMSVNRQGMLRVRVLDDDGGFTTQDIVEIRSPFVDSQPRLILHPQKIRAD